jgi:2,4-diketo-3-deoxy-L-fuconate hydrolase
MTDKTSSDGQPFGLAMISVAGCQPFAAMVVDDKAIALAAFADIPDAAIPDSISSSVRRVLEDWENLLPRLQKGRDCAVDGEWSADLQARMIATDQVVFHPPVDGARQVFCTGANYRQHVIGLMLGDPDMRGAGREDVNDPAELRRLAEETMDERAANGVPYAFLRLPETLTGAASTVFIPRHIQKPDWELELAVIIGRTARNVSQADALSYVAGYAIINDMTARELVFRKDMPGMGADWLQGKNWPNFGPLGPVLVPSCFVADPYDLKIQLWLNDRLMQDENTSDMVIGIERQIAYLSSIATLHPGDIIATGSPAGNGSHYGVFLKPGDHMRGEITGLGQQNIICA